MFIRIFALFGLAFALFGTQCWAEPTSCTFVEGPPCIRNTFSPGNTTGVYDFNGTLDGKLVVNFVTVRTSFTLDVTVNHNIDGLAAGFSEGTTCVTYNGGTQCDQYDFSGNAGGPNGVPVKSVDYKGLITLTLSYYTAQTVHTPAFLHAPGDNVPGALYTEDILTSYSSFPPCPISVCGDPTMVGKVPGLSSVAAFDEPGDNDNFCLVSPNLPATTSQVGDEIEVAFRLTPATVPCGTETGNSIRDKDARLSVVDPQGNFQTIRDHEGGKDFHFDKKDGVNERDLNTEGLLPGVVYTVTLSSDEFSPYSFTFTLTPCTEHCTDKH
jgi:hypothetical protein